MSVTSILGTIPADAIAASRAAAPPVNSSVGTTEPGPNVLGGRPGVSAWCSYTGRNTMRAVSIVKLPSGSMAKWRETVSLAAS